MKSGRYNLPGLPVAVLCKKEGVPAQILSTNAQGTFNNRINEDGIVAEVSERNLTATTKSGETIRLQSFPIKTE